MNSKKPFRRSIAQYVFLGLWLSLCAFPVFSAQASFSFIEFNIAFVLGVSLPVLLIALLMKPSRQSQWIFPTLLTLSLLVLLYGLSYLIHFKSIVSLSSAIVFVGILYIWPLFNELTDTNNAIEVKSLRRSLSIINASIVLYLLSVWFTPQVELSLAWGIVNILIAVVGGIELIKLTKSKPRLSVYRLIVPWGFIVLFSITVFLWLTDLVVSAWLVVFATVAYAMTLVNGNWTLLQQILSSRPKDESSAFITQDELFTFTHDPATNLPNYQQALKCFTQRIRDNKRHKLAAIVFKPINFQQVNSVLGHHNSDLLLLQLAYCLQKKIANNERLLPFDGFENDVRIARLQSLHFLVVVDLTDNQNEQQSIIDDLCLQLSSAVPEAMSFKSFSLNFELAFGIAFTGTHGDHIPEVIEHATDALLHAETNNLMVNFYDNSRALYTERQLLNMEMLKQDINEDNFQWYLQPQINMNDQNIKGFELMVHWYNDDKPLELHEFVKIAEQSGDVYLLTQKMVTQACSALFNLSRLGVNQPVAINLSSRDLLHPELVEFIEQQAAKFGVSTKYLVIELKESVIINANEHAKILIDQLTNIGVGIAIDNFSGNYESLRYIRKLAIKQVKINCKLLSYNEESRTEKAIVGALLSLAQTMKLSIVGFGVDNSTVKQTYLSMGGDVAQGAYVKHGVVFDELEIWLKNWIKEHPQSKTSL